MLVCWLSSPFVPSLPELCEVGDQRGDLGPLLSGHVEQMVGGASAAVQVTHAQLLGRQTTRDFRKVQLTHGHRRNSAHLARRCHGIRKGGRACEAPEVVATALAPQFPGQVREITETTNIAI